MKTLSDLWPVSLGLQIQNTTHCASSPQPLTFSLSIFCSLTSLIALWNLCIYLFLVCHWVTPRAGPYVVQRLLCPPYCPGFLALNQTFCWWRPVIEWAHCPLIKRRIWTGVESIKWVEPNVIKAPTLSSTTLWRPHPCYQGPTHVIKAPGSVVLLQ